jgi:hypothetical protein
MSEVRLPRVLVLLVFVFVIAGCKHQDSNIMGGGADPCESGTAPTTKQAPVVCVADTAPFAVNPDAVESHNVERGTTSKPVTLNWWTVSGGNNLEIKMIDNGCVTDMNCSGGHCWARSVPGSVHRPGDRKECKYDVWINGARVLDPTVVLRTCC